MRFSVTGRVTPLTKVQRRRVLPARGEVLVRPGQVVTSADLVARCRLPGRLWKVDLGDALDVPSGQATRYLRKSIGEAVQDKEPLAERAGLFGSRRRTCRAPVDGHIVAIRYGQVLIEGTSSPFELCAHYDGQVTGVIPERGVTISAAGALIEGAWGSGGQAVGVVRMVTADPSESLCTQPLGEKCPGALIVAGWVADEGALRQATEARVRGIIAGSVDAELCPLLHSLPYPVLVTEGFGALPMSRRAFSLLGSFAGRKASMSADFQAGWCAVRPELLVSLELEDPLPEEPALVELQVGARVRGLRAPYLGFTGTIIDLPAVPQWVESGIRLPVARVMLETGESVSIPQANLRTSY